jgi:hypothetical protein
VAHTGKRKRKFARPFKRENKMQSNRDNTLEVAIYSTTDAAHYLRVPHQTLRYWIGSKSIEPIVTPAEMNPPRLSFTNLMECYMLSSMRTHYNLRLPKVRKALKTLARLFPSPHPLVDIGGVGGERVAGAIWAIEIFCGPGFGGDAGALRVAGVGGEASGGEI